METAGTGAPRTARERIRLELTLEIKEAARRRLASDGAPALSLRAVARDVGMVSSAVYRYFPSRDALLTALIVDAYDGLGDAAERAEARVRRTDFAGRWRAICTAVRAWAIANPHEYALLYGSPVPGYAAPQDTVAPAARVAMLMVSLFADLWGVAGGDPSQHCEPTPLPRKVRASVAPILALLPPQASVDDLGVRGIMAWTYLFGAVSFELFGHREGGVLDHDTFFRYEMDRIGRFVGIG